MPENLLARYADRTQTNLPAKAEFKLERIGGEIRLPTNEFDENPIHEVKMVSIGALTDYGFTERFRNLVTDDFPAAGSYMGLKENIGL